MSFKEFFKENLKQESNENNKFYLEKVNKTGLNIDETSMNNDDLKKFITKARSSNIDNIPSYLTQLNDSSIDINDKITLLLSLSYRKEMNDTFFLELVPFLLKQFQFTTLFFKVSILDMLISKIENGKITTENTSQLLNFFLTQESFQYLFDEKKQLIICLSNRIKKIIILLKAQEAFLKQIKIFKTSNMS